MFLRLTVSTQKCLQLAAEVLQWLPIQQACTGCKACVHAVGHGLNPRLGPFGQAETHRPSHDNLNIA